MLLSGFGNWPRIDAPLIDFRGVEELASLLKRHPNLIARGNGRAYGDAALNPRATLSTLRHNRLIAFDDATGELTCESGVMLADILAVFLPRGWFPAVTPGTKFVTVGGMIAADVHGKNHHCAGSFGNHITRLRLMGRGGILASCSPGESVDLFAATCGGMGLTGVIVEATFRLNRVESAWIRQQIRLTRTLEETMAEFEQAKSWTYSVAWIDCQSQGRAVLYLGEHAAVAELPAGARAKPFAVPAKRRAQVPFTMPPGLINRWTARAFNAIYYRSQTPGEKIVSYEDFFYPLDSVGHWNRLYGRSGFTQYQCVLPKHASGHGLAQLLAAIRASGCGCWLATLKLFGPQRGLMSFPMEGYTLTVDLPVNRTTLSLLDELDAIVEDHGGRIYLAKDARSGPKLLRRGYPGIDRFRAIRAAYGADTAFSSLLSERVML